MIRALHNSLVSDGLVHTMPNVQQTLLQFVNVLCLCLRVIDSLVVVVYLEVNRIKVAAVRWPQIQ